MDATATKANQSIIDTLKLMRLPKPVYKLATKAATEARDSTSILAMLYKIAESNEHAYPSTDVEQAAEALDILIDNQNARSMEFSQSDDIARLVDAARMHVQFFERRLEFYRGFMSRLEYWEQSTAEFNLEANTRIASLIDDARTAFDNHESDGTVRDFLEQAAELVEANVTGTPWSEDYPPSWDDLDEDRYDMSLFAQTYENYLGD